MNNSFKILFIAEKSYWCYKAFAFVKKHFPQTQAIFWNHGEKKPPPITWHGDWIIAFKADLILSQKEIDYAEKGAINFHPDPPYYRGIGGYTYAVYNGDNVFGATCHHIIKNIDKGPIVKVKYFPLKKNETASSLRKLTAKHCFALFNEIMQYIIEEKELPTANDEVWGDKLYTYQDLDEFTKKLKSKNIKHNCLI